MLKYAQFSYGVDARAVADLGLAKTRLPGPGAFLRTAGGGRVSAASVIFLGVPDIDNFAYREIRDFGRRAVIVATQEAPDAREICVTLHGPGFGLDETESFESEVAGIVDAVSTGHAAPGLEFVTFLERDRRRCDRMQRALDDLLPGHRVSPGSARGDIGAPGEARRLRTVGYDSSARGHAFVAMPFDSSFDDTFYYGIAPSIRAAGLLCERMDEQAFTGDVVQRLKDRIVKAECVVADVTGANPNVYLEVGFAWGSDIPAILVCKDASELKFDLRGQRCILYKSIMDLEAKLTREIGALFPDSERVARP